MFSVYALTRLNQRDRTFAAYLLFFFDSWAESLRNLRTNPRLAAGVTFFSLGTHALIAAACAPLYFLSGQADTYLRLTLYILISLVAFTGWVLMYVGAMCRADGTMYDSVGLPNYLTILRFFLIVPVVVLFLHGFTLAAVVVYVLMGLTDIVDGVVARRQALQSRFGVVMDPLADVFSTAAVFATFLSLGLIPGWLFLILMVRYGMLIVGSFILFLVAGPIPFKATLPGKIVGVLQGLGAMVIMACVLAGIDWQESVGRFLFPLLGLNFASIVVSQAVLGIRHIRRVAEGGRKAVQVGS